MIVFFSDQGASKQTEAIQNEFKLADNGFANTNEKSGENVKVQDDNIQAKARDSTKEIPATNVNNYETEEKQSDKDDKNHVVLLQRTGETGIHIPQTANEIPKDKDNQGGGDSDDVDKKTIDIDLLMKEMLEYFSESPEHKDVDEEKNKKYTNNTMTKGGTEEILIASFSDNPTENQEEKTQTSANNYEVKGDTDESIESISDKREDVQEVLETSSNNFETIEQEINEPSESISDSSAHTDEEKETSKNHDDLKKDIDEFVESNSDSSKPENELSESISNSPAGADEDKETSYNNDDIKKDIDGLVESNSESTKHDDVQEETTKTPKKQEAFVNFNDEPVVIISDGDEVYIRDLFEAIEAS